MEQHDFDFEPMSLIQAPDSGGVFDIQDADGKAIFIGYSKDVRWLLLHIYGNKDGAFDRIHDLRPIKVATYTYLSKDDREAFATALVRARNPAVT